jgi:hypothetical protein
MTGWTTQRRIQKIVNACSLYHSYSIVYKEDDCLCFVWSRLLLTPRNTLRSPWVLSRIHVALEAPFTMGSKLD